MTEKEYRKGLEKVRKIEPQHPLLKDLERGYSKFNVLFLTHALRALSSAPKVQATVNPSESPKTHVPNPLLASLMREQSDLFAHRARLSNRLHEFPYTSQYDVKRAALMDDIKVLQRKIGRVMGNITHVKTYGELPPKLSQYDIPKDPAERERKKVSLRGSISHKRADLATLRGALAIDEAWESDKLAVFVEENIADATTRGKILRGYEKLNDLKKHLADVEKAIEADHIHAD